MRFIYTERNDIFFNKKVENLDLQGVTNKEILAWITTYRNWFGIKECDMKYIRLYFLDHQ